MLKLLMPVFESQHQYKEMAEALIALGKAYDSVAHEGEKDSRMLGVYYRVAFSGSALQDDADLNGKEFIYKEPKLTRLAELQERLKHQFGQTFQASSVNIVRDGKIVMSPAHSPNPRGSHHHQHDGGGGSGDSGGGGCGGGGGDDAASSVGDITCIASDAGGDCIINVQITKVEPYFGPEEQCHRACFINRHSNLTRFIFETPFTPSGKKTTSDVSKQWKRKTILTVDRAFPYMKKRLLVIDRQEFDLNPIQVAQENVKSQLEKLREQVKTATLKWKALQMLLQGTCLTMVQQGPLEFCKVFLTCSAVNEYGEREVQALAQLLRDLLACIDDGLRIHHRIMPPDQEPFDAEMRRGFCKLKTQMCPYLQGFAAPQCTT
eukprot:TRINITY_DN240_c6_g2_i3.p1 TRINITY_DN240_c6_g2~~TRINITY_DN240_c6_g2_i3.p1  ORF type:complete len:377 (-),score=117.76 TRINITY_DN240_c6_g2_i3:55-1185(-)